MTLRELVEQNRSCRRFAPGDPLSEEFLRGLVDLARLIPSAANRQPLKYFISSDQPTNDLIFPTLAWAAYLKDWVGPGPEERPQGYIIILGDTAISPTVLWDHAIAAQTIMLGAVEAGFTGCIIGAINRPELKTSLKLADNLEILLVIALGKKGEDIFLEEIGPDGDIKYWRDARGHHVPKRSLDEIIINS